MSFFRTFLMNKVILGLLFTVNLLGTLYGYYWYKDQLAATPSYFLPFVPDSPTASLFFCIVLWFFLLDKHAPLFEALAVTSLFKYGVWAVGMNIASGFTGYHLEFGNYMLIVSHACMAIEGLLYTPFFRLKPWHLAVAAIWLLHNEIIDYVFDMMPQYPPLEPYKHLIGYLTFWLSILTIALIYFICFRKNRLRV
ncbi:DUF1405 domain-containing protein [Camelliibacillus cellulosilyticus]|uniref:DUF1405 domain-containing protein n=1 Tax=Camelliibacillus cellulosilyticus TaxID=2174486 RepID=A0ABV9GLQ1_9BACL